MKQKFYQNKVVRKRFGQNFLTNNHILEEIIDRSNFSSDDFILEIGPGHGALTERIIPKVKKITAVEIDRDLVEELQDKFKDKENFNVVSQDVLKLDLNSLNLADFPIKNRKAIGNIPYYITTPIIMKFINEDSLKEKGITETTKIFSELTIMLQKEVGDRIVAKAGTKEYGALSVICQYACEVEQLVAVGKRNFYPAPKVDSVVIKLKMKEHDEFHIKEPKIFWRIVHSVFVSRRKNLKNSLKIGSFSDDIIEKVAEKFDLGIRGETMDLNKFSILSNLISEIQLEKLV